jgi:hypothetical protein
VDLASLIFGGSQAIESIPSALLGLRALREGGRREGLNPTASHAYLAFANAATDILFNLHFIANVGNPGFVGALWSWPPLWRAHRDLFDALNRLLGATSMMVVTGSEVANEAAYQFGQTIEPLTSGLVARGRKLVKAPDYEERQQRAGAALRGFLLVARNEMAQLPGDAEAQS